MLISDAQLAANRANSQKSTGPRTEEGKRRASLNAYKHGCTSQTIILPEEDLQAFIQFTTEYEQTLKPANIVELSLVQSLAQMRWSMDRMRANEMGLLALGHENLADTVITPDTRIQTALTSAKSAKAEGESLKTTSLYLQRNTRMFDSTLKQLKELQAERKAEAKHTIEEAANIAQIHNLKKIPFESNEYGLVCNSQELSYYMRRINARHNPIIPPTNMTTAA